MDHEGGDSGGGGGDGSGIAGGGSWNLGGGELAEDDVEEGRCSLRTLLMLGAVPADAAVPAEGGRAE